MYLARKRDDGFIYSIKVVDKVPMMEINREEYLFREKNVWKDCNNTYIAKLYYIFQSPYRIFFVMEYCPGGELFYHLRKIGRFKEETVLFYITELAIAISYLHERNIIYRDIKPENILLDIDGHIKLIDFGLSKVLKTKEDLTKSFCGSEEYLAPEMISKAGHNCMVDIYAIGILTYELLAGFPPFMSKKSEEITHKIMNTDIAFPKGFSDYVKSFIKKTIKKDRQKRLGNKNGIMDVFGHRWLKGLKRNLVIEKQI